MKLLGMVFLFIFSVFTYASSIPDFPFITVTGKSIRKVEPDKVSLRFYVITYDKEASIAKSLLNKTTLEILKILKSNGILVKNITSFEINKRAKRVRDKDYNDLAISGYEFTQRFEINIHDLKSYSELTNALLDSSNVENIESHFYFSKKDKIEVELIKEAAEKAKQKAEHIATGLGVKIDSVFAFNDTGSFSFFLPHLV